MDLAQLLNRFRNGSLNLEQTLQHIQGAGFEDLGFARVDMQREKRRGFPEVIFCSGKTPAQAAAIAERIDRAGLPLLATRADARVAAAVRKKVKNVKYCRASGTLYKKRARPAMETRGTIGVVSAGTSDIPMAEEAAITAEMMGNSVQRIFDVGVAGIHRLFAHKKDLDTFSVTIVAAGMEGALASVVGGLSRRPVIGLPTSIGYGTGTGGFAALMGMLNSCAAGVTVVNIDNGFGAGYAASLMNRK